MLSPTRPQANNHASLAHFLSRIEVGPSAAIPLGDCGPSRIVPPPPTTFLQAAFSVVRCSGREQNMMSTGRDRTFHHQATASDTIIYQRKMESLS